MRAKVRPGKVAVGSRNPVKLAAVRNIVARLWPDAQVEAVDVPSGVAAQPRSDEEAIRGARHRAVAALAQTDADLGVGLEGSVVDTPHGMFLEGWAVVRDRAGREGIASGGRILLPERIARAVRVGGEVGPVSDAVTGERNIKQKQGTVGYLTGGLVTRTAAHEKMVAYALAPFLHPELYDDSGSS